MHSLLTFALGITFDGFGVLAWWLLGRTHLARRRLQRQKSADRLYSRRKADASTSGRIDACEEVVPFGGPDVRLPRIGADPLSCAAMVDSAPLFDRKLPCMPA